ncbi:MAG TPA: division/cell wall cluster transcriptional repressor MraZ [Bacteroidales bacterium]|nr:division/cell wall cluster transcriptional repressor MraZ [Bacteroidales bacterium]
MKGYIGEYYCKLDSKNRFLFPMGLKKQLPAAEEYRFVINRGFEQCISLSLYESWQKTINDFEALSTYDEDERLFLRYFHRGATEVTLDGTNRLLIPKSLLTYAEIDKDIVISAYFDKIEIWNKDKYESVLDNMPKSYSALAQLAMGKKDRKNQDDLS